MVMHPASIDLSVFLTPHQLLATTFVVAFVSGFVPFVNIEAYLIAAVALGGTSSTLSLALVSTSGQMLAKSLLYLSGRGILNLPFGRHREKLERMKRDFAERGAMTMPFLFLSAFLGLPPFYIVSVLAGALGVPFLHFLAGGCIGRFLRFGLVAFFPRLVLRLWK